MSLTINIGAFSDENTNKNPARTRSGIGLGLSPDIYRFALFLCGDVAEAEEITAETFVCALTGKKPLVSATVKGYLLTIAKNLHLESV